MPVGGLYGTQRQLLEALRRHLAEPGPSRFGDETLYGFLDEAAHEVAEDTGCIRRGIELPLPANTERISIQNLGFDMVSVIDCFWKRDEAEPAFRQRLKVVSNEQFFKFMERRFERGVPEYATIVDTYLTPVYQKEMFIDLWPVPSENGIIQLWITALSYSVPASDRDTVVIPIRRAWRDLVIHKALQYCYENLGRPDLVKQKMAEYEKMLSGVRLRLLDYTTSDYDQILDAHGFGYI